MSKPDPYGVIFRALLSFLILWIACLILAVVSVPWLAYMQIVTLPVGWNHGAVDWLTMVLVPFGMSCGGLFTMLVIRSIWKGVE